MGNLYLGLGQREQARAAYGKTLAIAERLAQAEPDRADYQRDLSISLVRIGTLTNDATAFSKAWQILTTLALSGRLDPADGPDARGLGTPRATLQDLRHRPSAHGSDSRRGGRREAAASPMKVRHFQPSSTTCDGVRLGPPARFAV